MKVVVDRDVCGGCGVCEEICPEVFAMEDNQAVVKVEPVPGEFEEKCSEAVEECPAGAISIK